MKYKARRMKGFPGYMVLLACIVVLCCTAAVTPALAEGHDGEYSCGNVSPADTTAHPSALVASASPLKNTVRCFCAVMAFQTDMEVEETGTQVRLLTSLRGHRLLYTTQLLSLKNLQEKLARQGDATRKLRQDIPNPHPLLSGLSACEYHVFTLRHILI